MNQYVEELVTHVCEAPLRSQDVFPMVEMCSAIHQRYSEFQELLGPAVMVRVYVCVCVLSCLLPPQAAFEAADPSKLAADAAEPEVVAVVTRRRTALRLLIDLFVCGLVEDETTLQRCVTDLIKKDQLKKTGQIHNLFMLLAFVRRGGGPLLGIKAKGARACAWGPNDADRVRRRRGRFGACCVGGIGWQVSTGL